jgi:hypothetical protein
MSRYKTIEEYVNVEVSLEEWETEELIEEIKARNAEVPNTPRLVEAIDWYNRGNISETLEYLEQAFPELHGLSKKVLIK